ncbi:hypothetical protein AB687_000455 [Escherichia coli]|uniref:hypothetical protein n=1 Tax=Escherichia coli TaxID=562 RepID=UPI0006A19621|nr:hypothetical protein [Escherichia coli]HDU4320105.1 hypothetical protein [Klebsiella aerogenes]EEV5850393.1 hypothetical protein [Escherichia coli]EEV6087575.1 hypothetical protein [Escherichia coli]EEV7368922.1 hypothetical protein [Escherichia coli]EEW0717466.1 hypothetical protein [Escherichia coli]
MSLVSLATKYKDVLTVGFSMVSFIIACTSLFFSGRTAWHDRARLKIKGRVVYDAVYNKAYKIEVTVLNIGRRDAVLEGILCHYESGKTRHSYEKEGIAIKEKQRKVFIVENFDLIISDDEGEVYQLEDITILDIEGKEHEIPNSYNIVSKFIKDV